MSISALRHLPVFDPMYFNQQNLPIHIIGCGAIGSKVAVELAKLGVKDIHLWDNDIVEPHNIANQAFLHEHIKLQKIVACMDLIFKISNIKANLHSEYYTGQIPLSGFIFLCPDSIDARKQIWINNIKLKFNVRLLIDARMNVFDGRLYFIEPNIIQQIKLYEQGTAYTSAEANVSPCGSPVSVGTMSGLMANLAVNGFMRWCWIERLAVTTQHDKLKTLIRKPANELIVQVTPSFEVFETTAQ